MTTMGSDELRHLAGSLIMAGFRGLTATPETLIARHIEGLNLGGVILFDEDTGLGTTGRNIVGPEQLRELTAQLRRAAEHFLLIAVDQEGGQVARLNPSNGHPALPSAAELGARPGTTETRAVAERMAQTLADAGININLAPVVDLNIYPGNPIIGGLGRSFSDRPEIVIEHARAFVGAHEQLGVACAVKHFPGHGSSTGDTHRQAVDVTDTFEDLELQPYVQMAAEVPMVMVGHLTHRRMDAQLPASLSAPMIDGCLRQEFGFDGVVITDDLDMAAVGDHFTLKQRVTLALNAGVDLLLFANNHAYQDNRPAQVVEAIIAAVEDGEVTVDTLKQHARRVDRLRWHLAGTASRPQSPGPPR